MPVCQFCGLDSPGDSRFCGVCGRPFTNGLDASTSRSGADMQAPPPPPSNISSPYSQENGPSFPTPPTSPSSNVPPPPPGMLGGPGQQQTIRQAYPGTSAPDASSPTIRQVYPGPVGSPSPVTPAKNQSQVFLPSTGANSGEFNTTPAHESSGQQGQYDGGNQKLQRKKRSSGLRILTIVIILLIVLIGGVGSVLAFTYFHNKPSGSSTIASATATTAPTPTATLAPTPTPTPGVTPTASVTASATLTPTVGATATPAPQNGIVPQTPKLPLMIPCVNCSYPKLALVLSSITPDQANPQVTDWNLTITNNGTSACSNVNFNQVQLEDQSGTKYQGQGQASDTWTMNAGQQQIESPTFQVVPQTGVRYTLNLSININSCNDGTSTTNTYQTESFTF